MSAFLSFNISDSEEEDSDSTKQVNQKKKKTKAQQKAHQKKGSHLDLLHLIAYSSVS